MKTERIYFLIHSHTLRITHSESYAISFKHGSLHTHTVLFSVIVSIHRVHYNSIKIYISPYNTYLLPSDERLQH